MQMFPTRGARSIRAPALFLFVAVAVASLSAAAGDVVSIEHDQTYSPSQVNSMAGQLFTNRAVPQARYTVDVYMIRYLSTNLEENPTVITAQLLVPREPQRAEQPLYLFAPGTTGLTDQCRPLREHQVGINWGLYRHHVLAMAGQGAIGMIPEYMHFGDPDRLQPYFIAEAEARVVLDSVRAVRNLFGTGPGANAALRNAGVRPAGVFLSGFSQGGHAIFAAADRRAEYAPDVRIDGIIGYGPTTNIEQLFREFSVVAAPIIYTFAQHYGVDRFDPEVMLADRWLPTLAQDVRRLCILGLQSYYPWGPWPLFRPEFNRALANRTLARDFPEIDAILRENATGLSGHGVPVLILQGSRDVVVNLDEQAEFVVALRNLGSRVRYLVYDNAPHDTRQIAFEEVLRWMNERMTETSAR